ncbi:MAG: phosphoadenosine phosphosulfate reductase family protein [Patescibacteria group bacterium]|nr:phosphoadenosine phosphosulfate reductase family protein [Patescibacteria group bacterium]
MTYHFVIKASYGNDSVALIQWAAENELEHVAVLYNDTGWAKRDWLSRVEELENWVSRLGFDPHRTSSIGLEALVRKKKGWPRQGIQFCTAELKMAPTRKWLDENDPYALSTSVVGVRREESANRASHPEWSVGFDGQTVWAPLVRHTTQDRDDLLKRAGVEPLPHRSSECFPCINANRADIVQLSEDEGRVAEIEALEKDLGFTAKGSPRTMFRPYRYMGATGIREIVRWAKSPRGKFELDDGEGGSGCETGWCGV